MKFKSDAQRKHYDDFTQFSCLRYNSGACKNLNFIGSYLQTYIETRSKIQIQGSSRF